MNQEKLEKLNLKKLNFLSPSKLLGITGLALIAIGGSSFLGIQATQNSYQRVKKSQVNIKTENQSAKSLVSIAKIKSSNESQIKINKISFAQPLLSINNSSENTNFLQIKERQKEDFFSF